jgi:uncharacterized protein (TIGR00369 family)
MSHGKQRRVDTPSGFRHLIGMRVVELNADRAVMEIHLTPEHLNGQGSVHGGVLASLIDNTGGLAGCYCPKRETLRKAVTLSLTTTFTRAASSGTIRAVARKKSAGRKIFFSTVDVMDDAGNLVAFGEATYRYVGNEPAAVTSPETPESDQNGQH